MNALSIIHSISVTLGIITPVILFLILRSGINNSSFSRETKRRYISRSALIIALWSLLIWTLTLQGFFSYNEQETIPGFLLAMIFPVVFIVFLYRSADISSMIDAISLKTLAAGQTWRLLGAVFFLVALSGSGPKAYIGSGVGDITTGILAITAFILIARASNASRTFTWLLILVGMTDLILVLYIMISRYPLFSDTLPSTASAGAYPMMLIVGLAAPVALLLHIFMIRNILRSHTRQI